MPKLNNYLTDISDLSVGHAQDIEALTGCTVILCHKGATAGVDQRGGAPGTRETDLLHPMHLVNKVHAILLAGGSAFGLDAASGVMRYLEEKGIGFDTGIVRVPIVPAAVIFDLAIGRSDIHPNAEMGYKACMDASSNSFLQGNVGAGTGATVGKLFGMNGAMKSGLGSATVEAGNGLLVSALVIVNAFGDVINPLTGTIIAGTRTLVKGPIKVGSGDYFADTLATMKTLAGKTILTFAGKSNTVIGVVATNAKLDKEEINKVAQMSHDGLARVIQPAHTMFDGDTIFSISCGKLPADVNLIGACAAEAFSLAVINAVQTAKPAGGLPSLNSL
ncbi:MAG: peptidase S58 [Anaerolinea sp.]|nr:peptidase S58 [Anaerolinea sp.]